MDRKINAALSAFGMSGRVFHAPLLSASQEFNLVKILERHRTESAASYPKSLIVSSFDALCRDKDLDLIVINTPDHTHYSLAKKALEHEKHVVVEKPVTLKYAEALELCRMAEDSNLVLSVFHNRRWDGDFLTVQKVIREGLLGRLVSFESHFDRYRNFIQPATWKENPDTGTGTLYNLGSHLIDQALVLFGHPLSVFADIRAMRTGGQVDDSFEVWMEYPEVKVKVCGSYLVREPGPRYILHGTEGSFLKWGTDPQEKDLKNGRLPGSKNWGVEARENRGLLHTRINGKKLREKIPTLPGNYPAFYEGISRSIREGSPPDVTARQGAMVIRIIEAAFESMRSGKVVKP
ncbi:MAG: Gfo/Idh/MocA family oxidoreductase [Bacteroidales bacterium]